MDIKVANAVGGYLETLYDVNVKLIKLCGMDITNLRSNDEKAVLDIIQDIFRLFPYEYDRKKGEPNLDQNGGLLEFKDVFNFLEKDFYNILEGNRKFLKSIRQIRNKYEHKMHAVKIIGKGAGSFVVFDFDFKVEGENISVYASSFIALICQLNETYCKIQSEVSNFAEANDKTHYAYYNRLTRFNFNDFSKIYHDNNLRLIGKLMHTF